MPSPGASRGLLSDVLRPFVDRGGVAGIVAQVWRHGKHAEEVAIGKSDLASGQSMSNDTIFSVASMTKPVTTLAALKLVEAGKFGLSDSICRWLPEFQGMQVLRAPGCPLEQTVRAQREITVEDLMTHRSGLAYYFTSVGPSAAAHHAALGEVLNSDRDPDEWLAALGQLPLTFQPGERFHYGHSTDVLGFLIARVEGRPLSAVLEELVFEPLGMLDTGFCVPPRNRERLATIYERTAKGLAARELPIWSEPPRLCLGGGGLVTTAPDFLRFTRTLLDKGNLDGVRHFRADTIELMLCNRLSEDQRRMPMFGGGHWEGCGFGLGVSVIMDAHQASWMGAGRPGAVGWPGSFGVWWRVDPVEQLAAVFLVQDWPTSEPAHARDGARAALETFQDVLYLSS
jgi:CubicO group peptidase (beta-lactamase class C family)